MLISALFPSVNDKLLFCHFLMTTTVKHVNTKLDAESGLGSGQWTVDSGQWTVNRWTMYS
jgi:hypothetical protein